MKETDTHQKSESKVVGSKLLTNLCSCNCGRIQLTHLCPMHPFSTLWKHQKTIRFSDVFRGYRKDALGTNELSNRFWFVAVKYYCANKKNRHEPYKTEQLHQYEYIDSKY